MAEGGGDSPNPFNKDFHKPKVNRQLSRDDIGDQSRYLMCQFIRDRVEAEGIADVPDTFMQPNTPQGPPVHQIQGVASALRRIGDELDGDNELQSAINRLEISARPRDTFFKVAKQMFSDGEFNWGRVVMLFYFAYKLCVKELYRGVQQGMQAVYDVIEWVVHFIVDNVALWILDRGGWEAIPEYFGTPSGQFIAVLLTGILTAGALYWWRG